MVLETQELLEVRGGASSMSAAMLSAVIRGATMLYNFGTYVGTAVYRMFHRNYC